MLLALQIFNLSVSVIDFQPIYASASLYEEFNDLDTVIEYISEILLDYKNSFPEPEKPASNTQASLEKHVSFKLGIPNAFAVQPEKEESVITHANHVADVYGYLFFKEINPPPPKC